MDGQKGDGMKLERDPENERNRWLQVCTVHRLPRRDDESVTHGVAPGNVDRFSLRFLPSTFLTSQATSAFYRAASFTWMTHIPLVQASRALVYLREGETVLSLKRGPVCSVDPDDPWQYVHISVSNCTFFVENCETCEYRNFRGIK